MKISNPEKLILLMLSDIYDKLELTNIDTRLLRTAIHTENTWALDWEMPGVVGSDNEPTPDLVIEVINYLDMWSFLEEAFNSFDNSIKERIASEAEPFGRHVKFPGFDGNNEGSAYSIAKILVNEMGRFSRFNGRDLNSHAPLLANYARMYEVFEPIRTGLGIHRTLSPEEVIVILKAMRNRAS
ncbi:MAG: YfbU family protein [Methylophilus sp.]|uniref:YfbU family protein n=1 Tax=Methylophilus sp. TaxID=29541 RepID=UPI003FA0F2B9